MHLQQCTSKKYVSLKKELFTLKKRPHLYKIVYMDISRMCINE